jgi:hypothetical protein
MDCLVDDPDADRAEVAAVKVAAYEVPEYRLGPKVPFTRLTALRYVLQGSSRVALSFSAEVFGLTRQTQASRRHRAARRRCVAGHRDVGKVWPGRRAGWLEVTGYEVTRVRSRASLPRSRLPTDGGDPHTPSDTGGRVDHSRGES